MSRQHGKDTFVSLDGDDLSPHTNTSELTRSVDSHDVTCYGAEDHEYSAGLGDGKLTIGGMYDSTAGTGPRAVIVPIRDAKQLVQFIRRIEGTGSGKPQDTVQVLVTQYVESAPVADMVTWTCEMQPSGPIVPSVQP